MYPFCKSLVMIELSTHFSVCNTSGMKRLLDFLGVDAVAYYGSFAGLDGVMSLEAGG